jgi:nucleotide-binding universal stress UspA family protein
MFRHLLVPTDGSELSEATIQQAVSLARQVGAAITFVHALESPAPPPRPSIYGDPILLDPAMVEHFNQAERAYATALMEQAKARAEAAGVHCDTVLSANPVIHEAIIETAAQQGCDLIVMASHGRRGLSALVLGSETQRVLTHSRLPVLVCRGSDQPAGKV